MNSKVVRTIVGLLLVGSVVGAAGADELVASGTLEYTHTTPVGFCGGLDCEAQQPVGPLGFTVPQFPPDAGTLESVRFEAGANAGGLFAWAAAGPCSFNGICISAGVQETFTGPGMSLTTAVTIPDTCDTMTPQRCSGDVALPATTGPIGSVMVSESSLGQWVGPGSVSMTLRFTFSQATPVSNPEYPVFWQAAVATATPIRVVYTFTPAEASCPADFNGDGIVNSTDVSDFVNQWFEDQVNGTLKTDFDGNGVCNSTDVSMFINAWLESVDAGC